MFESDVVEEDVVEVAVLDAADCVAAIEANETAAVEQSCRRLVLAAHWADLHPGDTLDRDRRPGRDTSWQPGGDGTPTVSGFAMAELGCALATTAGSAARLTGDALDLRHRLPRTWRRVLTAEIPGHHARRIAQATRHLSPEAAARVDREIAPKLTRLSYGRLETCLDAAVLKADPATAEAQAAQAMADRFVRLGRSSEHGLKWIIARATAGDAIYLDAMLTRLAEILAEQGDPNPLDIRRSTALGILAQPAHALKLLYDHAQPDEQELEQEQAEQAQEQPGATPADDQRSVQITPPPFDPDKVRPKAVIYLHLSADSLTAEALTAGHGVARMEGIGPVLLTQLRRLLGQHTTITVRPVIDLNDEPAPVDSYEVPDRMREHLILTNPADRFPYSAAPARTPARTIDIDHTIAYRPPDTGGPPRQTRVDQLAPLTRYHHRIRTHGGWQIRQPDAGVCLWRTPHGRIYLVNSTGTHPLGASAYAHACWQAAAPQLADDFGFVKISLSRPSGQRPIGATRASLKATRSAGASSTEKPLRPPETQMV